MSEAGDHALEKRQRRYTVLKALLGYGMLGAAGVLIYWSAKDLVARGASPVIAVAMTAFFAEFAGLIGAVIGYLWLKSRDRNFTLGLKSRGERMDTCGRVACGILQGMLGQFGAVVGTEVGVDPAVVLCAGSLGCCLWAFADAVRFRGAMWRLRSGLVIASIFCVLGVCAINGDAIWRAITGRGNWLVLLPVMIGLGMSVNYAFNQLYANRLGARKEKHGHEQHVVVTQFYVGLGAAPANLLLFDAAALVFDANLPHMDVAMWIRLALIGAFFISGCWVVTWASTVKKGKASATVIQVTSNSQNFTALGVDTWVYHRPSTWVTWGGASFVLVVVWIVVGWLYPALLKDRERAVRQAEAGVARRRHGGGTGTYSADAEIWLK